jgi:hypothetical protein
MHTRHIIIIPYWWGTFLYKPSQYFRAGNIIPQPSHQILCPPFLVPCCCSEGAVVDARRPSRARVSRFSFDVSPQRWCFFPAAHASPCILHWAAVVLGNQLPRCLPANCMDFESTSAHALKAADSWSLCHASQIVQTEFCQRLAVQLKSLENLGRTSHNERLAMYRAGQPMCVYISIYI